MPSITGGLNGAPAGRFLDVSGWVGVSSLFRTRRDAELTRRIYERHPVLVNHSKEGERRVWPVRYRQGLFHSLNHSTGIHPPSAAFP